VHINGAFSSVACRVAGRRQFLPPKDPARLGSQDPQQAKLGRRQRQMAAVNTGRKPPPVQNQTLARDPIIGPAGRLDPGQQGAEPVFKVIPLSLPQRRATRVREMPCVRLVLRRQQKHGPALRQQAATDLAADVQGVGIRQIRIQQHNVRLGVNRPRHAAATIGRRDHGAACGPQAGLQSRLKTPGSSDHQYRGLLQHVNQTVRSHSRWFPPAADW